MRLGHCIEMSFLLLDRAENTKRSQSMIYRDMMKKEQSLKTRKYQKTTLNTKSLSSSISCQQKRQQQTMRTEFFIAFKFSPNRPIHLVTEYLKCRSSSGRSFSPRNRITR